MIRVTGEEDHKPSRRFEAKIGRWRCVGATFKFELINYLKNCGNKPELGSIARRHGGRWRAVLGGGVVEEVLGAIAVGCSSFAAVKS